MKPIDTARSIRRYQLAGFVSMFVVLGAVGGWAAMSRIQGAVIAPAVVAAESFTKKIQHKEGGIVAAIRVKDGDNVVAGQELVLLDDTEIKAELGIAEALMREFLTKRARLEAQRDGADTIVWPDEILAVKDDPEIAKIMAGQEKLFNSRRAAIGGKIEQLEQQIGQLREQIEGFLAQQNAKIEQIKLIDQELVNLVKLQKKGLVPAGRVLAMERERSRLEGERGALVAEKASSESKIGEIRIAIIGTREEDRSLVLSDLRDAESRIAELAERRLASRSRLGRTSIKAPIDGTVYQIMVHTITGVIAPGEPVMLLVPKGDTLVLEAQVAPMDIDQVQKGQTAIIRFPALSARTTPELWGEVLNVAGDTSRNDTNTPPFYAVRLRLKDGEDAKLLGQKLVPGMPAEAFIQTNERSPLSYLLKPLADQIAHTFRES